MNWRKQIRRELKTEVLKHKLISLKFAKSDLNKKQINLQFIKEDEFRYNNSMYDIVKTIESKDSITYICYLDIKEMLQISSLMNIILNSGIMSQTLPILKSKILENQFYIILKEVFHPILYYLLLGYNFESNRIPNRILEVITPPPKIY